MALNSFVTRTGGEIGRAQVAQAEAAGVEPLTLMNPILLKPCGGASQVVVEGSPIGVMTAREYYGEKERLWPRVTACYDALAAKFDVIVLEGAGSPVEINLMDQDLTNLKMARHAEAATVLVADIERGGVFAQIVGTWELLPEADRRRMVGFVINKFRGDVSLLDSGLEFLRERTGRPVLGVLPYRPELQLDQEDSLGIEETASDASGPADVEIVVAQLPGISNFTDFAPLARMPDVRVRYVERARDLGRPDLVILPGTKTTVRDLRWLRHLGIASAIGELREDPEGPVILGICGGFQMLGATIDDPLQVESIDPSVAGLGLLDVTTRFAPEKAKYQVSGRVRDGRHPIVGYEIHMGRTRLGPGARPFADLVRHREGTRVEDGAIDASGRVIGTYVHGLFDGEPFASALIDHLRRRKGLGPLEPNRREAHREAMSKRYAGLSALLRENLDLGPIRAALGISR